MKNLKDLVNEIKGLDSKKQAIIFSATSGVVAIGIVAGIMITTNSNIDNFEFTPMSQEERDKIEASVVEKPMSDEVKDFTSKTSRFIELTIVCSKLGIDYPRESPTEDKIDEVIKDLEEKIKNKNEELVKEDSKENETFNDSNNESSNNSNNSSNNGQSSEVVQKPVEQPSTPPVQEEKSVVEEPVVTTPSIPSGWKDDVAQEAFARMCVRGITNLPGTNGLYDQEEYNTMYSKIEGYLNGNGDTIANINSSMYKQFGHLHDGGPSLYLNYASKFTISGLSSSDVYVECLNRSGYAMNSAMIYLRVYYDANTNTSTIYYGAVSM